MSYLTIESIGKDLLVRVSVVRHGLWVVALMVVVTVMAVAVLLSLHFYYIIVHYQ